MEEAETALTAAELTRLTDKEAAESSESSADIAIEVMDAAREVLEAATRAEASARALAEAARRAAERSGAEVTLVGVALRRPVELVSFVLRAHLDEAREHYEAFCESMHALGREVRRLDEWQYQRVDAYPGWDGRRDVGAGNDMSGWLDEIERFLEGKEDEVGSQEGDPR